MHSSSWEGLHECSPTWRHGSAEDYDRIFGGNGERSGRARWVKIDEVTARTISVVLSINTSCKSRLATDEGPWYKTPAERFAEHLTVVHSAKEYVRARR
jgi:hypothetical protein